MAKAVSHACFKYLDDQIKYYYEPIESIFYKKNDKDHIRPKHLFDFEKTHKYYVLWQPIQIRAQVPSTLRKNEKEPEFYPGYIVCLGESEADARVRAANKPKRLAVPKVFTSSESNENISETQNVKPQTSKIIKKMVQKVNSQRTIDKYKQSTLLMNREVLRLDNDCMSEDNAQDIENDSTVNTSTKKMQTMQKSSQRELRVVLEDFLKTNKENRDVQFLNDKIAGETIYNLDHYMSLPTCSTPKRRMEKFSYSFQEHSINFLRPSYPPYVHRALQTEFSIPQKDRQHVSSVVRDTKRVSAILQLSPIFAGSQLTQSQKVQRSQYQTQRLPGVQIPLGSEIFDLRIQDLLNRTPLSEKSLGGSRSKSSLHYSLSSRNRLRSRTPLNWPRGSPGGLHSNSQHSRNRSRSRTPLNRLRGSPGGSRSNSQHSRNRSRSSVASSGDSKLIAKNFQTKKPGPRSRTQRKSVIPLHHKQTFSVFNLM